MASARYGPYLLLVGLTSPKNLVSFKQGLRLKLNWGGIVANSNPESGEPKEKQRRGYSSLEAIDPRDGGKWGSVLI